MLADSTDADIFDGMIIKDVIRKWINWKSTILNSDYTQDMLSRDAGVYPSNLSEWTTGKVEPTIHSLEKLAKAFGVSVGKFIAGPPPPSTEWGKHSFLPIPEFNQSGAQIGELSRELIPLMTSIPAGSWKAWINSYPPGVGEEMVERCGVRGEFIFAVRVEGDSMVPYLFPGDVLYIDPERAFTNFKGGIGVVKFDESFKIRQIWHRGDNYLLEAANKAFDAELVPVTGTIIYKIVKRVTENEGMF